MPVTIRRGKSKAVAVKPGDRFFMPFQERWIKDRSRIKLWEKSRQLGASWCNAYSDARKLAVAEARHDIWISSRDQIQSTLYIADVRKFGKVLDTVARSKGKRVLAQVAEGREPSLQVEFANGKKATALGSLPDAQAGKRGDRVLDEFAVNRDPKRLYGIAYPGIQWGGQISIISTHRGSGNYFNTLVREIKEQGNPKSISLHTTTLTNALDEGFLEKLQAKIEKDDPRKAMSRADFYNYTKNGCPDTETFLEEFECIPADDTGAFLPYDIITPCEYALDDEWESSLVDLMVRGNPLWLGLDIGRTHDLTCFWLLEQVEDIFFTRALETYQNVTFDSQAARLDDFMRLPNLMRACIDKNGIGMQLAENARKKYGHRVEEVQFTNESKSAMAYPVRTMFERRAVRIPADEKGFIRADLHSVRKIYTEANNIRFAGDRGANGHADRFWGLALARNAAERPMNFVSTLH